MKSIARYEGISITIGMAASFASASAKEHTWTNPVDIDYRYNFEQMNQGISYRTGADPAVVRYEDAYYPWPRVTGDRPTWCIGNSFRRINGPSIARSHRPRWLPT